MVGADGLEGREEVAVAGRGPVKMCASPPAGATGVVWARARATVDLGRRRRSVSLDGRTPRGWTCADEIGGRARVEIEPALRDLVVERAMARPELADTPGPPVTAEELHGMIAGAGAGAGG